MLGLAFAARADYPAVVPGGGLAFPADEGAHPEYRTEWWYVTGWLAGPNGKPLGFQVTFFRSRPAADDANPSAFAARQVLIGHAALSDPALGHALHAERIARAGFGLADAGIGATAVSVGGWQLAAQGDSFVTAVTAADFAFRLNLARTGPPVANGQGGYSQKGPAPASASRYYSIPGLRVTGEIVRSGHRERVTGEAWLDHEWSSAYLDADSVGWDWIGLNLADGGSLMAFRIRDRAGNARWAGGTLRRPGGAIEVFAPADIGLRPLRVWRSPHTAISWPVAVGIRAGALDFTLQPLLDDQESDSRLTTGAVYWEGAVEARAGGRTIGRGYLELTGYGEPLRLR
jgi:predicted secreted hydrolase